MNWPKNFTASDKKRWRNRATRFLDKHLPLAWRRYHQEMREELAIKFAHIWNAPSQQKEKLQIEFAGVWKR